MTIKTWKLVAGALLIALIAGVLGYGLNSSGDRNRPDHGQETLGGKGEVEEPSAVDLGLSELPRRTVETSSSSAALRYLGWETRAEDTGSPKACLLFSQLLNSDETIEYRSFLDVTPDTAVSLEVDDSALCLLGLDVEETYQIVARAGLEAGSGDALPRNARASVAFAPKPAMVSIDGDGIIVPRADGAVIGVSALNAPKVDFKVYRVSHRALFQETVDGGDSSLEGDWSWFGTAWNSRVEVHSETLDMTGDNNRRVEMGISLEPVIEKTGPGAYIVQLTQTGEDEIERPATAWRWLYVTDLALTSYRTNNAMHVTARSIDDAQTKSGVRLVLIASNNDVLGEAETDAQGRAVFEGPRLRGTGNRAPKYVMAYAGGDDFAALDISRAPLDLSAYDVQGRSTPGLRDGYLFTERGIYRPGETVHLSAIIRDRDGAAAFDRPGTLTLSKPDGSVFRKLRVEPSDPASDQAGVLTQSLELPTGAPLGMWSVRLDLDGLDIPAGSVRFSVQDFIPERLRLDLKTDDAVLRPQETRDFTVQADFLYGAPGRDLDAEVEARLQVDPKPFTGLETFSFGNPVEPFSEVFQPVGNGLTDDEGQFETELDFGSISNTAYPLRAFITAGVAEPGGRYVRDSVFIPVRTQDIYIGFDPVFEGNYAPRNQPAMIDIVAVNADGARIETNATYELYEEDYNYLWFRNGGRWTYRRDREDILVSAGKMDLTQDDVLRFSKSLEWGQYRLQVTTPDGMVAAHRFGVGWSRNSGGTDAPDRLSIGLSDAQYEPGQAVTLTVNSPYAGRAELVLADQNVRRMRSLDIREGANEITLETGRDWSADLYAMLSVYTPASEGKPRRAFGLVHIPLDRRDQRLSVSLDAPETVRPRQAQSVRVSVDGLDGETGYVTLAAVDTGILQLTDHTPPDPESYLYGKTAMAFDIHDDYSRMLAPFGAPDRFGGDQLGGSGLAVIPVETVSLFQGAVSVDRGRAEIVLDLPDFQGELTLMATATSKTKLGSASTKMIVRDPVSMNLALPRFLAPGDRAVATLTIDNVEGAPGPYAAKLLLAGKDVGADRMSLKTGERGEGQIEIRADGLGIDEYALTLTGGGETLTQSYSIQTRAIRLPETRTVFRSVAGNTTEEIDFSDLVEGFVPGSIDTTIAATTTPNIPVDALLASLSRYPYGCSEQLVSTAMPLLLSERLGRAGVGSDQRRRRGVSKALAKLSARQGPNGVFGLWSAGDGYLSPYTQLYISDFVLQAAAKNYPEALDMKPQTLKALRRLTKLDGSQGLDLDYRFGVRNRDNRDIRQAERAAYAHALLAREGEPQKADIVYLQRRFAGRMTDSVALSQLGFALQAVGLEDRAADVFEQAGAKIEGDNEANYYDRPYRNGAALLALGGDALSPAQTDSAIKALRGRRVQSLNTHEKAWALMAAAEMSRGKAESLVIDRTGATTLNVTNDDTQTGYVEISVTGQPDGPMEAASAGARVTQAIYDLDGTERNRRTFARGEQAIIVIDAKPMSAGNAMWVVADLLPAGFEIESILTPAEAGKTGPFSFLGNLAALDVMEARDDRFVASFRTLHSNDRTSRRMAFIVRAVTQGDFADPGVVMEDMYRPDRRAQTAGTRIEVGPASSL